MQNSYFHEMFRKKKYLFCEISRNKPPAGLTGFRGEYLRPVLNIENTSWIDILNIPKIPEHLEIMFFIIHIIYMFFSYEFY